MKYKIIDWAGNVCFHGKTFPDFEDAWGFIRETCPDEEDWQEYSVIPAENIRESRYLDPKDPRAGMKGL
jgi:hypothetical protein